MTLKFNKILAAIFAAILAACLAIGIYFLLPDSTAAYADDTVSHTSSSEHNDQSDLLAGLSGGDSIDNDATVNQIEVSVPTANSLTYNGSTQTGVDLSYLSSEHNLVSGTDYEVSGQTSAIYAGESYSVTVTLKNNGYKWAGTDNTSVTINWSIARKTLDITVTIYGTYTTSNSLGDVDYAVTNEDNVSGVLTWVAGDSEQLTVGSNSYYYTWEPANSNYNVVDSSVTINVIAKTVSYIRVTKYPTTVYTATETFSDSGMVLQVYYNDNTSETISGGWAITIDGSYDPTLHYGTDGTVEVTITYAGCSIAIEVQVSKKPISRPVVFTGLIWNGFTQTGVDFSPLTNEGLVEKVDYIMTGVTSATDAGTYYVAVSLLNTDYSWSAEDGGERSSLILISWSIAEREVQSISVTTKPGNTTYTALESFSDSGMAVMVTYNNGDTETITGGWSIEIDSSDDNSTLHYVNGGQVEITVSYEGKSATFYVTVNKIALATPTAESDLVYTGETLTGVKEGTGYTITGNTAKDAGTHTATATLISSDYKWLDTDDDSITINWSIAKASLNVKVSVSGTYSTADTLGDVVTSISGTNSVSGTLTWNDGDGANLSSGETAYSWTWTPYDTINYNVAYGSTLIEAIEETVEPEPPETPEGSEDGDPEDPEDPATDEEEDGEPNEGEPDGPDADEEPATGATEGGETGTGESGLSDGAIAGITVGSVAATGAAAGGGVFFIRRRRRL